MALTSTPAAGFSFGAAASDLSDDAIIRRAVQGYPNLPKYRDPFIAWLRRGLQQRIMPEDAITCKDVGTKREVALSFAEHGLDVASSVVGIGAASGAAAGAGASAAAGAAGASAGTAASTAGTAAASTGAGVSLGAVSFGIGAVVVAIIGAIFSRHKAKVQEERLVLCEAVPACNEVLRQVDQKVFSGAWSAAQGLDVLRKTYNEFATKINRVVNDDGKKCNAGCGYRRALRAQLELRERLYAEVKLPERIAAIASTPTGAGLGIAAVALAGWWLLKGRAA